MDTAELVVRENVPSSGETKSVRNSGIDLLRILAMMLICLFHAHLTAREVIDLSQLGIAQELLGHLFNSFGMIGNVLFVICSSWFLADKGKASTGKALAIIYDASLISIAILAGFLIGGYALNKNTILHQILPTVYQQNWFIPCYVVFYLCAPIIGQGLKAVGKKAHLIYCAFFLVLGGGSFLLKLPIASFFTGGLFHFFFVYGLVCYIKWYMPRLSQSFKANLVICLAGLGLAYGLHLTALFLAKRVAFFAGSFYSADFLNPFFVIGLIGLFNLFKLMPFKNRIVSYLGASSLVVYCAHENYLLRTYTRVDFYTYVFERCPQNTYFLWVSLCGLAMFVGGFAIAALYGKTISRFTGWAGRKTAFGLSILFNKLWQRCSAGGNE